jgi:hypothetical protein
LVEIKCHAERPNEVSNEEVVKDHGTGNAEYGIVNIEGEEEEELCKENADAEVDDEFDRVGSHIGEDDECNDCAKASKK